MASLNSLRQVADALPSSTPRLALPSAAQLRKPKPSVAPPQLPQCFAPLLRRVASTLPHHRRQCATLDAVAAAFPPEAARLSGSAAAAAYLLALVSALHRYVATSDNVRLHDSRSLPDTSEKRPSKKQVARQRLNDARQKHDVSSKTLRTLIQAPAPTSATESDAMRDDPADVPNPSEDPDKANQTVGVVAAFVSLIALAVQGATHAVINLKADEVLEQVLAAYSHVSGYVSVAHHTNTVIVPILSVLTPASWKSPTVQSAFLLLLRHCSNSDDAFRDNSCKLLTALFNCPRASVIQQSASTSAASYYCSQLQSNVALLNQEAISDSSRSSACTTLLHILANVDKFAKHLSPRDVSRVVVEVFSMAVKDMTDMSPTAYNTLSALFLHHVSNGKASDNDPKSAFIPQAHLTKIFGALVSHKLPEECPDVLMASYMSAIASGISAYVAHFDCLAPPDEFILKPVHRLFEALDPSRGQSSITRIISQGFQLFLASRWFTAKPQVLAILQAVIEPKYRSVWGDAMPVLRKYLESGMCAGNQQMQGSLKLLVSRVLSVRQAAVESHDRKAQDTMESVVKSICRGGGTATVLSQCRLRYDENQHVTNGWLLSLLRDNIEGSSFSVFCKELIPVAEKLDAVLKEKLSDERVIEAKNVGMYKMQVWSLLPGFCTKPSDLLQDGVMTLAFQAIYACLTSEDQESRYLAAVGGLRQLALSVSALSSADPTSKANVEAFASRLKKLFPTIVNVACSVADERRSILLNAVSAACRATNDASLVSGFLRKGIKELLKLQLELAERKGQGEDMVDEGKEEVEKKQHAITDIAIAIADSNMIPVGAAEIEYLEKAMTPFFTDKKASSLQKKAYRVSAKLIASKAMTSDTDKLLEFAKKTADASSLVAAGAKAARLGWIRSVVNHHICLEEDKREDYLGQLNGLFLSEIILSTRDASEKCRSAALDTLVNTGRAWYGLSRGNDAKGLEKFVVQVAGGLGGKSVSMLAGTIGCIGQLLETFRYEIAKNEEVRKVVDSLFGTCRTEEDGKRRVEAGPIGILLRHDSVEVQRAAVGAVKVGSKCCNEPEGRLIGMMGGVVTGLVHVAAGSNKKETRLRVRVVLERLVRKCGLGEVEAVFPKEHLKLLAAVRRQYSREMGKKLRAREEGLMEEEADDGMEEIEEEDGEGEDDEGPDVERELLDEGNRDGDEEEKGDGVEVVDLLEQKGRVGGAGDGDGRRGRRGGRGKKDAGREVKYSEDGKPIFVESDDESAGAEAGSVDGDDDDGGNADGGASEGLGGRAKTVGEEEVGKKRKLRDGGDEGRLKKMKGSFGEEYRGRKAAGDVKRSGRPDPYAYVPLGPSMFAEGRKPGEGGVRSKGTSLHRVAFERKKKGASHPRGRRPRRGGARGGGLPAKR